MRTYLVIDFSATNCRVSKLEEEHSQALESSADKIAAVKKERETLQQETDKLRSVVFLSTRTFLIAAKLMTKLIFACAASVPVPAERNIGPREIAARRSFRIRDARKMAPFSARPSRGSIFRSARTGKGTLATLAKLTSVFLDKVHLALV